MSGPVVLNTRTPEQAPELTRLLRAAAFDVVEAPATAIVPAWDPSSLDRVRTSLTSGGFDWIVLPSANAGRELVHELRQVQPRIVCGTSTASALDLEAVALALPRFSAAAALEVLRPLVRRGARVLVPRAAEGREELIDGLRAHGLSVYAPVAYRTVAVPDAAARLGAGGIHVLTLCSPSAVHSVASAIAPEMVVVCLGETTANAVRDARIHVAAVARHTSMPSLVEAITEALGARV